MAAAVVSLAIALLEAAVCRGAVSLVCDKTVSAMCLFDQQAVPAAITAC